MATLIDPVVEDGDAIYGWCGLCHSFAEFPHECAGKDSPAQDLDGSDDIFVTKAS
jgi:hypothetical protein